ncbi:MAG: hypothetical protein KIT58_04155 [Planctomycetota bacterium]|nr:hypothetical protein [Planctomycetota bacterium]
MGELDVAAKVLLRTEPKSLLALALPGVTLCTVRAEEAELPASALAMDKLFRVEVAGQAAPRWRHMEGGRQLGLPRAQDDVRLLEPRPGALPAPALVRLVLKPGNRQGAPKDAFVVLDDDGEELLRFRFGLLCAWWLDAAELLGGPPGLLPLLPFTRGASPERVVEALRRLGTVRSRARKADLLATTAAFAGNVYPEVAWRDKIPMEILMASSFYQQILAEGEARGVAKGRAEGEARGEARGEAKAGRAILLRLLRRRFGATLPRRLLDAHLPDASAAQLEAWAERVLTAERPEDVFARPPRRRRRAEPR